MLQGRAAMFSRGRGRGGAGGGKTGVKREEQRGRGRSQTRSERKAGGQTAQPAPLLQAAKRSGSSRSPGQSSPARARAATANTKKARGGSKAEELKADSAQLTGSSEDQEELKIPVKPAVRKQKFPRVNDNPEAPEVVDVPNMRSSFIAIATPCENGTSQNGSSDSVEKPGPEVSSAKVTFDDKMPLLAEEEKCPAGVSPAENGANNNQDFPPPGGKQKETLRSPDKSDSIILIPLNDESEGGEGKNLSEVEVNGGSRNGAESEGSEGSEGSDSEMGLSSKSDTEGDLLTKMIRENLNKAVNDSDDSFTDGNTDDMKQSLLNAIKNTLRSSNSSRHQATDTDGEEAVANGSVASHPDSDLDIEEDEAEPKIQDELLKTGDTIDTVDTVDAVKDEMSEDQKDSALIAAAELEISPDEPTEKSELDPLKTSGDGINDLPTDVKPSDPSSLASETEASSNSGPEGKPEEAKVAIPLSELEQGMMLVESVQIEQIEADGSAAPGSLEKLEVLGVAESNIAVVVMDEAAKPKLDIDKNALFSQMNDKFAKDTHAALKNRPVYQKRSRVLPSQTEVKEENPSSGDRPGSPSSPSSPSSPPPKKKKVKENTKKIKKDKEETVITDQEEEEEEVEGDSEVEPPTLTAVVTAETNSAPAVAPEENREENSGDQTLPDLQPGVKPEDDSDVVPDENNSMEVEEKEEQVKPPADESVKNDEDEESCDTPESREEREVTPEDQEEEEKAESSSSSSASSSSSPDEPLTQPICDSPAPPTPPPLSQSDLTKSLRKVRLAKKSPAKPPKDKDDSSLEEDWSDKMEVEEETAERAESNSSPSKEISGGNKAGTEVFDFTDDEDIPLSNIDLDVFESGGSSEGGQLMINIPEPQPTLDHELSKLSSSSSKISPTKSAGRKFAPVSPQVLSARDAMAAVAALQLSPHSLNESGGEKYNGEVMSDDTDNSARTPANFSEKGKLGGRKKRRMQESDGGKTVLNKITDHHIIVSCLAETEDDLENNKKDARPKRMKNHSGALLDAAGRPASAASVTSITSEDRRDLEDIKRLRDHQDGKQTPDSQKEEKNM